MLLQAPPSCSILPTPLSRSSRAALSRNITIQVSHPIDTHAYLRVALPQLLPTMPPWEDVLRPLFAVGWPHSLVVVSVLAHIFVEPRLRPGLRAWFHGRTTLTPPPVFLSDEHWIGRHGCWVLPALLSSSIVLRFGFGTVWGLCFIGMWLYHAAVLGYHSWDVVRARGTLRLIYRLGYGVMWVFLGPFMYGTNVAIARELIAPDTDSSGWGWWRELLGLTGLLAGDTVMNLGQWALLQFEVSEIICMLATFTLTQMLPYGESLTTARGLGLNLAITVLGRCVCVWFYCRWLNNAPARRRAQRQSGLREEPSPSPSRDDAEAGQVLGGGAMPGTRFWRDILLLDALEMNQSTLWVFLFGATSLLMVVTHEQVPWLTCFVAIAAAALLAWHERMAGAPHRGLALSGYRRAGTSLAHHAVSRSAGSAGGGAGSGQHIEVDMKPPHTAMHGAGNGAGGHVGRDRSSGEIAMELALRFAAVAAGLCISATAFHSQWTFMTESEVGACCIPAAAMLAMALMAMFLPIRAARRTARRALLFGLPWGAALVMSVFSYMHYGVVSRIHLLSHPGGYADLTCATALTVFLTHAFAGLDPMITLGQLLLSLGQFLAITVGRTTERMVLSVAAVHAMLLILSVGRLRRAKRRRKNSLALAWKVV